jgi:hypothetical protein
MAGWARGTMMGLLVAAAPAFSVTSVAQGSADQSAAVPSGIDEVVVRGRRMSEVEDELRLHIKTFIGEVIAVPPGRGYARWHRSVCVSVLNLAQDAAQYLVDRISALALDVGLEPGEPGCAPEVHVVFTTDAKQVATQMVERDPLLFRPGGPVPDMSLSRAALDKFASSERAVRWWHVSMPVDARTGQRALRLPGDYRYPTVSVGGPSLIHSGIRDDLRKVIIIVDGTKLKGTTWQQLGDYLAVVSLAQVNPDADPGAFDSILNLFTNPTAYSGLTDWDRAYVRALYSFEQHRTPTAQTGDLISEMARGERAD